MQNIDEALKIGKKPKKSVKKILILIIILLSAGGGGWYYYYTKHLETKVVNYKTTKAKIQDIVTKVSATGNLEPTNLVEVGIEVSGTISDVLVDFNDQVFSGEVMAKLDTTRLRSALESSKSALLRSEANVLDAKATLDYATEEYARVEQIFKSTDGAYPSQKELDLAKTDLLRARASYDMARAQREQSRSEVETNQYNLDRAIVVSPIDGIVLERIAEVGQTVQASMQTPVLFKMAKDLRKMQVVLSIDEADIGEIKESQSVEFKVDAYSGKTFRGVITQVRLNSELIDGVIIYKTVVEVDNDELLLRPGMTVNASITTKTTPQTISVPNSALRFNPPNTPRKDLQGDHVWVLRGGEPKRVELKVLNSDGQYSAVELDEPLKDEIITAIGHKSHEKPKQ